MSETANARLVRCPKCGHLLPEFIDFSVHHCGGCGALLSAKNKGVDLDTFSEKSYEERTEGSTEKLSDRYVKMKNISGRRNMDMADGSDSDARSAISSSSKAERRRHNRAESRRTNFSSTHEKNCDVVEPNVIKEHKRSHEFRLAKVAQHFEDPKIYHANENFSRRVLDGRMEAEVMRYRKEGPSNPVSRPGFDYENPTYGINDDNGDDRAVLLKKLEELTAQLSRSGNLINKGKEKVPMDQRTYYQDPYASEMNRVLTQNPYHDPQNNRPPYTNQYPDPPPLIHSRQEMGRDVFYSPQYAPRYGRDPHQTPMAYNMMTPSHEYKSGPCMDDGMMYMGAIDPYPHNFSRHHPSCSCYECRNKRQVSTPLPPHDGIFNYHDNPRRDYNHRFSGPLPLKSQSYASWSSDVNSEADSYIHRRPPRVHLPSGGKKFHPIAGGAPFFTCYNCFELLFLPKKIRTKNNDQRKKMSCGSCSSVVVFMVSNNKLVFSSDVEHKDNNYVKSDKLENVHQVRTAFSSDDCDNSRNYNRSNKPSNELKDHRSTSMYTSEAEEDNESPMSKDERVTRPLPGSSSLQDHFEYSNKYTVGNRLGEGNRSGQSEKEKVIPNNNGTDKQILRNESSATEIDLSSNEYSNTGTTFDSGEASNAAKSLFSGIGFNDYNRSNEDDDEEKANVTVNGHLISYRLIKKAEKLAGPIQPGNYWYDFRAGFWGAIGGPCLGIIPPFIGEFNYPLLEHCAGGNTHVFVNGRELNQKDLNLLVSRGLPKERDRSYIVEISGRVLDEDTGEELQSLGKLAPTVERMKHGFGMRDPKAVA
ncbi:hypothetical protein OROMI_014114 [Orobanche minor]